MELLLLGAGAVVLIAITLWIVWPASTADTVGSPASDMEVSRTHMTEDRDRGVTTAPPPHAIPTQEPVASTRGQRWPEASIDGERIGQADRADNFPYGHPLVAPTPFLAQQKTIGFAL